MDKLTNVDWIWEQRFPIEELTEEELNRIVEELWRVKLLNIEEIGDVSDIYEDGS